MNTDLRAREIGAIVALLRSGVVPADRIGALVEEIGSALDVHTMVHDGRLALRDAQLPLPLASEADLNQAIGEATAWLNTGYDIRTVLDSDYPPNLRAVFNRPALLFLRGIWLERDASAVAIVGTRSASEEGLRRAAKLSSGLAAEGITIISGLARGVDAAAHIAALEARGRTVAVIGTGVQRVYPAEHRSLRDNILTAGGAVVSQFFPDQPPTKWTFPKRNIVMSGLSLATIVVEAGITSGARVQAYEALRHGRAVFLLRSLVESHEWAREYVESGKFGVRAMILDRVDDVLRHLNLEEPRIPALSA